MSQKQRKTQKRAAAKKERDKAAREKVAAQQQRSGAKKSAPEPTARGTEDKLREIMKGADDALRSARFHEAFEGYGKALELLTQPGQRAKVLCGQAAAALGFDASSAVALSTHALEANSEYAWAYAIRGNANVISSKHSEAIADFAEAARLEPWEPSHAGLLEHARQLATGNSKPTELYEQLSISTGADSSEIRDAYRSLASAHKGSDEAKFAEVSTAYAVLSSDKTRALYDQGQSLQHCLEVAEQDEGSVLPADVFALFFSNQ